MRIEISAYLDYAFDEPADVLLQLEAAAMADQRLLEQSLVIHSDHPIRATEGEDGIGQRCWAHAEHRLVADYRAVVAIERTGTDLAALPATPLTQMPGELVRYLMASRYCESDRLEPFVQREFAGLAGGALAGALAAWVGEKLEYRSGSSSGSATAITTFVERRGVCRDYAHLLVALARAGGIPARCVAAYAPGVDPPDFHAVAELWLGGAWHLVDATGMATCGEIARVCVGRDATDIAFMTIWGSAVLQQQRVAVRRID